jgi:dihydropteroate synthase
MARLSPALAALIAAVDVAVSIDTTKAAVARLAIEAGAVVVNDQWGLQRDSRMAATVAEAEAGVVVMHNRETIDAACSILDDMRRFFDRSLAIAAAAGIERGRIILDPGIGFGKTKAQNLQAMREVGALRAAYGCPILVGISRKSLFAALIGARAVEDRLIGTIAANITAAARGAAIFRVHDCAENLAALRVFDAIERA